MQVTVKLFATLREGRFKVEPREFPPKTCVKDVLHHLGIKPEETAIILVNGRDALLDFEIQEGDTVSIFPPVGGG